MSVGVRSQRPLLVSDIRIAIERFLHCCVCVCAQSTWLCCSRACKRVCVCVSCQKPVCQGALQCTVFCKQVCACVALTVACASNTGGGGLLCAAVLPQSVAGRRLSLVCTCMCTKNSLCYVSVLYTHFTCSRHSVRHLPFVQGSAGCACWEGVSVCACRADMLQ